MAPLLVCPPPQPQTKVNLTQAAKRQTEQIDLDMFFSFAIIRITFSESIWEGHKTKDKNNNVSNDGCKYSNQAGQADCYYGDSWQ